MWQDKEQICFLSSLFVTEAYMLYIDILIQSDILTLIFT